jgi:FkbM family methyltransferase
MSDSKIKEKLKEILLRTHHLWSKVIPNYYHPYRFTGGNIYLSIKESPMMLARALGKYECSKHKAIVSMLSKGGVFIDVGANKGDFSLLAAKIVGNKGSVFAFEPEPNNCRWIKKSIERNNYSNIELFEIALSDVNGSANLYIGKKSGWHTLVPTGEKNTSCIFVKTRTLDDFLDDRGWNKPINMMKVDVEGADMEVLRGSSKTLDSNEELILLIDLHPHLGVVPKELCTFLENKGFNIYYEKPPFNIPINGYLNIFQIIAKRTRGPNYNFFQL